MEYCENQELFGETFLGEAYSFQGFTFEEPLQVLKVRL